MTQMEYFEASRKVPPTYQNILYTEVCIQMLPCSRSKMVVLGNAYRMGNILSQEFSAYSFSQQYLLIVYFWYNIENLNIACILDNIIDSILISWVR